MPLEYGEGLRKTLQKGVMTPLFCYLTLYETHTAAEIISHIGPQGISEQLVSEAKTKVGSVLFNGLTDGRLFSLQEGVLFFLIHIGFTAQDNQTVISCEIGNGLMPYLYHFQLNLPLFS
jgi:hypothetical protein